MPSPRAAAGNSLWKDRRRTAERAWMVVESRTPELSHQVSKAQGPLKNVLTILGFSRCGGQLSSGKLSQAFGVFTECSLEFFQYGLELVRVRVNGFGAQFADMIFQATRGHVT